MPSFGEHVATVYPYIYIYSRLRAVALLAVVRVLTSDYTFSDFFFFFFTSRARDGNIFFRKIGEKKRRKTVVKGSRS